VDIQQFTASVRGESSEFLFVRVRFDDQIFTTQTRGGVSRYFVELIREFNESPEIGVHPQLGWRWTRNAHALEAGLGRPLRVPGGSRGHTLRWANRTITVRRPDADITHHTYYGAGYLSRRSAPPMAVTVYDMTPELFPDLFPKGNPHRHKREYVRRATLVLCISESTRRDLLRIYGSVEAPTIVTHLGVSDRFAPGALRPSWCPDRYVLFLGNRGGYKDFRVAIESFAEVAPGQRGTALVAVGGGTFTADEEGLISRWGLRDHVLQRNASDEELPGVLGGARAFVFPSRYEGFGLPTLEAMACGTPTVLADSSSHPEVGGDAALYFPPGDCSALAAQLSRLLSDDAFRRDLSEKGIARASRFTWRRTAEVTADAYRMAAAARR
jgi:glycosyltransferase involved in cell wall biosynthesis